MRIGTFSSLSNPKKRYSIFRDGRKIANGGEGINWRCSCEQGAECSHLKCLWAFARVDKLQCLLDANLLTLTRSGKSFFKVKV